MRWPNHHHSPFSLESGRTRTSDPLGQSGKAALRNSATHGPLMTIHASVVPRRPQDQIPLPGPWPLSSGPRAVPQASLRPYQGQAQSPAPSELRPCPGGGPRPCPRRASGPARCKAPGRATCEPPALPGANLQPCLRRTSGPARGEPSAVLQASPWPCPGRAPGPAPSEPPAPLRSGRHTTEPVAKVLLDQVRGRGFEPGSSVLQEEHLEAQIAPCGSKRLHSVSSGPQVCLRQVDVP